MAPVSPTVISGSGFNGDQPLSRQDISKLILGASVEATKLIPNHNGKVVCTVSLSLRNNNHTVDASHITLSGLLFDKEKAFRTSSIWGTPEVSLVIGPLPSSSFTFPPGSLASNYLDYSNVPHKLVKKDQLLPPESITELGITGFCLRLLLTPIAQDWLNFTLLLFPRSRAALLTAIPDATHPGFPGLKIWPSPGRANCSIPLHPQSEGVFPGKRWGCPLAPGIIPGAPWAEVTGCPSVQDLRGAVCHLLRAATVANFEKDATDLAQRWAAIEANPSSIVCYQPNLMWPVPPQPPAPAQGRATWRPLYPPL